MNKLIYPSSILFLTKNLQKSFFYSQKPIQFFSQQKNQNLSDLLKTYLQIIPPHQIYQIVESKEKKLQNLIKTAQKINLLNQNSQQHLQQNFNIQKSPLNSIKIDEITNIQKEQQKVFKQLYKYIKKQSPYVPTLTLSKVVQVCVHKSRESQILTETQSLKRKTYLKILRQFRYKTEQLPLEDVVEFIYKHAKLNMKQFDVMKAAENVIIQEKLKINYPLIRKILWAFTHMDVGSSVLYSHISKTLKMGQHELEPLELAESAYMLSKVSQNAKGGYGIFQLAEKHVEANLSRMNFPELIKASSYLLTQNIGSNSFQQKLQAEIYKKYPTKDKLGLNDFLTLLKATSAYYFKFNDKALFNILKTSTVREAKNSTLSQFEDIVWSWGRLGKGDQQLWQCLQSEIRRRLSYLKVRQIAFFYHSLSSYSHASQQLLSSLQQHFLSLMNEKTNQHYFIKLLLGMQKQKKYNSEIFLTVSMTICDKINTLSKNQLIAFFKVLNESDYDYTNKTAIEEIIRKLNEQGTSKLLRSIFSLKLSEICEILYTYIKLDIKNTELIDQCFFSLSDVMKIPKQSFVKALFCFTIKDNYEKAFKMCIILEQLLEYGPIGYFFSPYEFPLMAYCIIHLHYHSKGALQVNQELLGQVKATLRQINPVILNDFVKKAYDQSFNIINQAKTKNVSRGKKSHE